MFRTRMRKIIRDVWARKGRTALVSIAIFIGVTGTIALSTMSFVITEQLNNDLKEDELSMLEVFLNINRGSVPDDATYIQGLKENIEGVTAVEGVLASQTQFKVKEDDDPVKMAVYGFSTPLEDGLEIEPMRLLEGGSYPTAGANEIVVEKRAAERFELEVGDTVLLRVLSPSRQAGDGERGLFETWTVSGIVFHPYAGASQSVQFPPDQSIYANLEDAQYINGIAAFTNYRARFEKFSQAEDNLDAFKEYLQDNSPYNAFFAVASDPAQNQVITSAQTLTGTMTFLAILALVVSGFLVINVISSLVNEQKQQIGIMKTVGATQPDNFFIFAGIALAYGVIGVIPALIVSIPLGSFATHALAPQVNTLVEGFQFSLPAVLIGVGLGLFIPVGASVIPVYNGTRVRILEAITDLGITQSYGSGPIAKLLEKLPIPITIRQGLSNVTMKKVRLLFTVITLAVAVGAFVGIFGMLQSIQDGFGTFLDLFNVEIGMGFGELRDPDEVEGIIAANFQTEDNNIIRSFEPAGQLQMEVEGYDPQISAGGPPGILGFGYQVDTEYPAFNFTVDEGETLTADSPENAIVVSSTVADGTGAGVGDTITLNFSGGPSEALIVGIVEYPVDLIFMNWRYMSREAGFVDGVPEPNRYFTTLSLNGAAEPVTAIGMSTDFAQQLPLVAGDIFDPELPTVVISDVVAENNDLTVGDTITLTATTDAGTSGEFTVSGIVEIPPEFQASAPPDLIAMFWRQLADLEGIVGTPRPQFYFMTTTLDDPTEDDIEKLGLQIEEAFLEEGIAAQTANFIQFQNEFNRIFFFIQAVLQGVVLLIAAVGALGLLTTLSMSVYERQKEIGVMRSIGASSSVVATQFLTEGIVVGIIAWLIGLPIGAGIQLALLKITDFDEIFGFVFSPLAVVVSFVGVLIITTIASLWPSISAARKTVSDILRYQ